MYDNKVKLNGMVDRRENSLLELSHQNYNIINLLTINLMVTGRKN